MNAYINQELKFKLIKNFTMNMLHIEGLNSISFTYSKSI